MTAAGDTTLRPRKRKLVKAAMRLRRGRGSEGAELAFLWPAQGTVSPALQSKTRARHLFRELEARGQKGSAGTR